ncbi:hypothetical protein M758_6G080800 [Ceratodon purpureus]|nr:hypothetical protein M758_6G080800 [Ceratodon purpureus]
MVILNGVKSDLLILLSMLYLGSPVSDNHGENLASMNVDDDLLSRSVSSHE